MTNGQWHWKLPTVSSDTNCPWHFVQRLLALVCYPESACRDGRTCRLAVLEKAIGFGAIAIAIASRLHLHLRLDRTLPLAGLAVDTSTFLSPQNRHLVKKWQSAGDVQRSHQPPAAAALALAPRGPPTRVCTCQLGKWCMHVWKCNSGHAAL
jgi:hypothetical protein